jgi:hypothetical protein
MKHECAVRGRSNCEACMQLEIELWEAINRYASSVGGDPSRRVYGNVPRMQAVADVNNTIRKHRGSPGSSSPEPSCEPGRPLPVTASLLVYPDCAGTVGKRAAQCGQSGYCSNRCWTIGRLRDAREQVASYEQQLAIYVTRRAGAAAAILASGGDQSTDSDVVESPIKEGKSYA